MAQCTFLEIRKIKSGTDKNGRNWTMNILKARLANGQDEEVSIFQPYNQDIYNNVLKLNPGDVIDVETEEKNGKKNIVDVRFVRRGKLEDAPASAPAAAPAQGAPGKTGFREPDEIIRGEAVAHAVAFAPTILGKAKYTTEQAIELVFSFAQEAVDFVKGKKSVKDKPDESPADPGPVDEPEIPDVPNPDDDDVPF
jgi:hypothetical protein